MDASEHDAVRVVLDSRRSALEHVATGSKVVRDQVLRDLEDAGRSEQRVRQDYFGRYPIELLQNAHDACADASVEGRAWIAVTSTALLVGNAGAPFDAGRIASLTRLGASTKDPGDRVHHTIGYKGIGFSAVFEITDCPQIIGCDSGLRFGFDRWRAVREVETILGEAPAAVSARSFPFELTPEDWREDAEVVDRILADGATTVIRCPFRNGVDAQSVADEVRSQIVPEVLLFMDAIDGLVVDILGELTETRRRVGEGVGSGRRIDLDSGSGVRSWVLSSGTVPAPAEALAVLDDEMWSGVESLNCAVALPWSADGPDPGRTPSPIHVYFPTSERHSRAFVVHGDFYVTSNRRYIETVGPGGEISRTVAKGAAALLAELVTSLRDFGEPLLSCLSLKGNTGGFGEVLSECILDACRQAPMLLDARGSQPLTPESALRVPALDEEESRVVLGACLPTVSLVRPTDDRGGAAAFLDELKTPVMDALQVAMSLDPRDVPFEYEDVLSAISDWRSSLSGKTLNTGFHQALINRPIVQDELGTWCPPVAVRRLTAGVGEMPHWLRKPTLKEPNGDSATRLVDGLLIRAADLSSLLAEIASRYANGPQLLPEEAHETLEFLVGAWSVDRSVVQTRLKWAAGDVRIPAVGLPRGDHEWMPANRVYFGSAWTEDSMLEDVYGPFGECEFLALDPGEPVGRLVPDRSFFEFLGVASSPRTEFKSVGEDTEEVRLLKSDPRFIQLSCTNEGHRRAKHRYTIGKIDRLERLARMAVEDPSPLMRLLASVGDPFGPPTAMECTHPYHQDAPPRGTALSYRRAVVDSQPWVPVRGDAMGRDRLPPWRVWFGVDSSREHLCLPRAAVVLEDPARFGLVATDQPTATDLAVVLCEFAEHFDRLADAPDDVVVTADWLLSELDRVLRRDANLPERFAEMMVFPAFLGARRSWQSAPVIADVPGLEGLPALPVLPEGRWSGLARVFKLQLASHVVAPRVISGQQVDDAQGLTDRSRVDLVAGLHAQGVPLATAANRVANLSERIVDSLEITVSYSGANCSERVPHFLDVVRGAAGQITRAEQFRVADEPADSPAIAQGLAPYLESSETIVHQLLNAPSAWLDLWYVGEREIAEATDALARARRSHANSRLEVVERDRIDLPPVPSGNDVMDGATSKAKSDPRDGGARGASSRARDRTGDAPVRARQSTPPRPADAERAERPLEPSRSSSTPQKRPRRLVSYAEVVPEATDVSQPEHREAIELVDRNGVDAVLEYERERGRTPQEQEHGNPGFDVLSEDDRGVVRFIEVKSISGAWSSGAAALTRRQVDENRAKGDAFWLYIVEGAADPTTCVVRAIQNPVEKIDRLAFADDWVIAVSAD